MPNKKNSRGSYDSVGELQGLRCFAYSSSTLFIIAFLFNKELLISRINSNFLY